MSGNYISKVPVLVVALVIGIVLVTSAVVPLASDYSEAKTFTNEGYFKMTKYAADADLNLYWSYETKNIITVNDVDYDFSNVGQGVTVAFAENFGLRIFWNLAGCQLMISTGTMAADVAESEEINVTITEGTLTAVLITAGTEAATQTVDISTPIYCVSSTGDYVMKKADVPAYMLADTEFIGLGITSITGAGAKTILIKGTIEDGATASIITTSGTAATLSDPVISDTEVTGYVDLYKLDKITFKGIVPGSADTNITYNYFVVPYEVSADPDNPVAYKNLVKVVPLMAFIMLVVAAAGMVYFKNKD